MKKRTLWFAAALCLLVTTGGCDAGGPASPPPDVVDTTPPVVSITAPASGEEVVDLVTVAVEAYDDVGVERVELWVGGRLEERDYEAPWGFDWDTRSVDNGIWAVQIKAYDAANNEAVTPPVEVEVGNVPVVTFVNESLVPVQLVFNGGSVRDTLAAGASWQYSDPNWASIEYEARTTTVGALVQWSGNLDLTTGRDREIPLTVSSEFAYFYIDNQSPYRLHGLFFDYPDFFDLVINGPFPAEERTGAGYAFTGDLMRVSAQSEDGSGRAWSPGVDFQIAGTSGQTVELRYP